ncbi:hypothetical protein BD779DRAFT_1789516, partial [Infundibulicybe gibba]
MWSTVAKTAGACWRVSLLGIRLHWYWFDHARSSWVRRITGYKRSGDRMVRAWGSKPNIRLLAKQSENQVSGFAESHSISSGPTAEPNTPGRVFPGLVAGGARVEVVPLRRKRAMELWAKGEGASSGAGNTGPRGSSVSAPLSMDAKAEEPTLGRYYR